ncbi:MAG: 8-oxo-(d)GTP phosphatase [Actinomycetota bacterium]|jgi:8-oxo-dGTP diphosphatase
MSILLVRHAIAVDRHSWGDASDDERPLRKRGRRQADALVGLLSGYEVGRVLSSPFLRCVETVAPLAIARGVAVERTDDLAEGAIHEAMSLVRAVIGTHVVMCSHGDVIPRVLEHFVVHDGIDLGSNPTWAKASTWVLEDDGERLVKAFCIDPPH